MTIDKTDAIIDAGGIIGDVASVAGVPGKVTYGISEVAEGACAVKDIYDAFKGSPSGITKSQIKFHVINFFADGERLTPVIGVFANFFSLGLNFGPATTINIALHY
jgi:hypothetical protein